MTGCNIKSVQFKCFVHTSNLGLKREIVQNLKNIVTLNLYKINTYNKTKED